VRRKEEDFKFVFIYNELYLFVRSRYKKKPNNNNNHYISIN